MVVNEVIRILQANFRKVYNTNKIANGDREVGWILLSPEKGLVNNGIIVEKRESSEMEIVGISNWILHIL